jgi:hypothetical protein
VEVFRRTLVGTGALLVGFHVWLFAGQVLDGRLADAALVGRWALAGGLLWGFVRLRRRRMSLVHGRQAVALWVLAALLHGPAAAERFGVPGFAATPEIVATVAPIGLAAAVAGLALLFGVAARRRSAGTAPARSIRIVVRLWRIPPDPLRRLRAPRPPPVSSLA